MYMCISTCTKGVWGHAPPENVRASLFMIANHMGIITMLLPVGIVIYTKLPVRESK